MRHAVLVLAGMLLGPSTLAAQRSVPPYVGAGSTVRVTAPSVLPERVKGSFRSAAGDTLRIAGSGGSLHFAIPFAAVKRLEVSEGRQRMKWMWLGMAAGAVVGTAIGGVVGDDGRTQDSAAWGRLGGFLVGVPVGAVAGAVLAPERWRNVMLSSLR